MNLRIFGFFWFLLPGVFLLLLARLLNILLWVLSAHYYFFDFCLYFDASIDSSVIIYIIFPWL